MLSYRKCILQTYNTLTCPYFFNIPKSVNQLCGEAGFRKKLVYASCEKSYLCAPTLATEVCIAGNTRSSWQRAIDVAENINMQYVSIATFKLTALRNPTKRSRLNKKERTEISIFHPDVIPTRHVSRLPK